MSLSSSVFLTFFFVCVQNTQLLSFKNINWTIDNYIRDAAKKNQNSEPVVIFPSALRHWCMCSSTTFFSPKIIYSFWLPLSSSVTWVSVPAGLAILRGAQVAGKSITVGCTTILHFFSELYVCCWFFLHHNTNISKTLQNWRKLLRCKSKILDVPYKYKFTFIVAHATIKLRSLLYLCSSVCNVPHL